MFSRLRSWVPKAGTLGPRSLRVWSELKDAALYAEGLRADASTGLEVRHAPGGATLTIAGTRRRCWARASADIGPATGSGVAAQMTPGVVRLWFTDADGLRTDSEIDVEAFNGSTTAVTADRWLKVENEDGIWQVYYEDCEP